MIQSMDCVCVNSSQLLREMCVWGEMSSRDKEGETPVSGTY